MDDVARKPGFLWFWKKEQEGWGLTYLQQTQMSFLIMIGTHGWERLFPPSVCSGGSRGRHLLASWGSWGSWGSRSFQASQASWRSRGSRGSRGSPASPASPAAFTSRVFRASWVSRGSCRYGGAWGCGGFRAYWASRASNLGSSVVFFGFWHWKNPETQKQDWKKTYLFLVTECSDHYLDYRPEYLNLISYITMSIILNKLQYINSYCQ